jgi:class 3 adenylate cyclase
LASRLESTAVGGQILVSEATARSGGDSFTFLPHESLTVKNRLQSVSLFEVKWN